MESLGVKKAALIVLGDLLPGCVHTVAADLCLQPCRKEPLLKTNGITFQQSWCQGLESRPTFDNFTQFNPADLPQVTEECTRHLSPPTPSMAFHCTLNKIQSSSRFYMTQVLHSVQTSAVTFVDSPPAFFFFLQISSVQNSPRT